MGVNTEEKVDRIMEVFDLIKSTSKGWANIFTRFNGAVYIDTDFHNEEDGQNGYFTDVDPVKDLDFQLNVKCLTWSQEYNTLSMLSLKSTNAKQSRGRYKICDPRMVAYDMAVLPMTNRPPIAMSQIISWRGNTFVPNSTAYPRISHFTLEEQDRIRILLGIQFTNRYDWVVQLGYPDRMKINFITNPSSIRDLFKLRDVPEGKKRRESLRNWVSEHKRKRSTIEEDTIYVKKHLRGATSFSWDGLEGVIYPAQFDQELVAKKSTDKP